MIYYLEVIKEGLSICLDSDINFYHHYQIGDIIEIDYIASNREVFINSPIINSKFKFDGFIVDWGKVNQKKFSVNEVPINSCINSKYIVDITKQIIRNEKLNEILNENDTKKEHL
jgi:hypothetical protein